MLHLVAKLQLGNALVFEAPASFTVAAKPAPRPQNPPKSQTSPSWSLGTRLEIRFRKRLAEKRKLALAQVS